MVAAGLGWVRIGEFAWSRMEPEPGQIELEWLDRAIETLGAAGLKVILGTPTATPPRWMLDRHPDMLAHDAQGRARNFGSRRHYCFSHLPYRQEARRITGILARRYGPNPHVAAWQTDNEYGCHDTTLSYSPAAASLFREWLSQKYQSISALNRAWGNVFWSMEYGDFFQIDLPNLTVTEPNPAHVMDFRRFSSDQVVAFNRAQVEELRQHTDAPIIHNYMGRITDFDHFDVGADLDIASWDSYPMGFLLDRVDTGAEEKRRYLRQGDPDFQAFHHDLYRAVGRGRWWVMEQQPGPVNWAPWNPAPLPGMARLWAWEAFAHGAETVCYFRWRQAPFAQEQMHAGLLRPDSQPAPAMAEVIQLAGEISKLPDTDPAPAPVALVFDYRAQWASEAERQGQDFDYFALVFDFYRGLRRLGLTIDVVSPDADLTSYALVIAPGLITPPKDLTKKIKGRALIGPRTGAKTSDMSIPDRLPPAMDGLEVQVAHVETMPPDAPMPLAAGGAFQRWREELQGTAEIVETLADGRAAIMRSGNVTYLGGWPDADAMARILRSELTAAGISVRPLPAGLRCRDTATHRFWFNYGDSPVRAGDVTLEPAGVFWEQLG